METAIEKLVEEKKQLDERLRELKRFNNSEYARGLKVTDFALRIKQQAAMQQYSDILKQRLHRFELQYKIKIL